MGRYILQTVIYGRSAFLKTIIKLLLKNELVTNKANIIDTGTVTNTKITVFNKAYFIKYVSLLPLAFVVMPNI